ncbi:hypothetical protein GH5_02679 [Leishmania sp. Ghana 2012 LV757]|uniref:hypothetical protein n=1 Tax=Leishmania sp. Ghana 2012 LV757 TaxID=2803181 RepID=UPI001B547FDA|nr:hypothetical protein GH5_02679 [Leishmania sp. Ghana 2012 LV757]
MRAEAELTFLLHPSAGTWGSEVHLRVDVEGGDGDCGGERCGAAGQAAGNCDALSSSVASSCTLLVYASRHHALRRVFVHEEVRAAGTSGGEVPRATAVLPASANAELCLPREGCSLSRRIEVQHYSWQPCRRPIRHCSTGNREAMPLAKPSDRRRHSPRGETAAVLTHRFGEPGVTSVESDASPFNRPHLFSSSASGLLEATLEEEGEGGGGDRLVLHFDSSSLSTSSPPSASCAEAAIADEASLASANVAEEANRVSAVELAPSVESLPAPVGPAAVPRILRAGIEASTSTTVHKVATESIETSVSRAPRRLLLLCPGSGSAPCSLSTSSSGVVQPAAPCSSVVSSAGGSRVLHINAVDAAKADTLSAAPAQKAPTTTPLLAPAVTTTNAATEASCSSVNVAATAPSTTLTSAPVESGAPECCEGQPFLLSFAYPDCLADGATPEEQPQTLSPALTALKGRRTFAVHLEFSAVGFSEATFGPGAVPTAAPCSWGNVASCGWPRENLSRSVASSELDEHCAAHRVSHGYSVIVGDASRQSCCWMCPLVAAVLPGDGARCYVAPYQLPISSGAGELHAGPLLDVWVRAVSGRQLSAPQTGHRNAHGFPYSRKECALKDQPHPQEGVAKLEVATFAKGVCGVPAVSSLSYEPSRPLLTTVFTASWLSQLCCVFTPGRVAMRYYRHPHTHDVLNPRSTRRVMWPSSHLPSLVWVATQVTQDCIVTHPRFLAGSKSSQPPCSSEIRGGLRYFWLRSDPHQCDALHRYLCRVFACWASTASTPFSASPSHLWSSPYPDSDAVAAYSPLDIIVTKANPPSLSLRGGAVGTASTVVMADEALRTAALEVENAEVGLPSATATPPGAAAGRRRLSPSALRARAAITAAVLQHLMWSAVKWVDKSGEGEMSRTADVEGRVEKDPGRANATPPPPRKQHATLLEAAAASRLVCAARALAVHWVCGSPSVSRNTPTSLMDFLAEERLLLSSVLSVGRLLKGACAGALDPFEAPTTLRQSALLRFATQYASASFAALGWLSHHAADTQLLREDGFVSLRLHEAELTLLRSVSALQGTSGHGRLAAHRWSTGEYLPFGLCPQVEEPHPRSSRGDGAPSAAEAVPQTLLRGRVNVRIEHAAVMNAFMVHLEWTTVGSTAVCDAPPPVRAQDIHAKVEVPFLLLVFVVADDVGGAAQASSAPSSTSDDESLMRTRGVGGCTARLYQVTPFSWHLSAAACAANGSKARITHLLMHALDLVARRPDVFEGLHVQAVTGLGIHETAAAAASARSRRTAKRARGRQGGPLAASAAAASRKHEERAEAAPPCRTEAPFRAVKRRRACVSDGEADSDGSETCARGEDGGRDAKAYDTDASTLVRRLGSSRGFHGAAAAVPSADTAPARRPRPDSGPCEDSSAASLSFIDTVRVVPVVVFRQDAAAPLLEVEVSQASQLAAHLARFGRRAASSTSCSDKEDGEGQEEASRVLRALLDHWIGFSSLHAAAPHYIEKLRVRQRQRSLGQIAQLSDMSANAGALADRCVLHAYANLLRSLWRELAHLPPSSSLPAPFSPSASSLPPRFMSADALRPHVLAPACVARAVEVAIAEYVRQDVECRRALLFLERDAAALWKLEEADEEDKREGGAGSAAGMRRRKLTKQTQQRHRQRLQAEMAIETAAQMTWAPLFTHKAALVGVFYAEVLGEFSPSSQLLQSGDQHRATCAKAKSTLFCEATGGGVVPWSTSIPRDIVASEKSAAFQSSLRSLLHLRKAEEEEQPPPRRGDTTGPAFGSAIRLQLTGEPHTKSASPCKMSSSKLPRARESGVGDAADLDVTVAELAKACAAQLSHAPSHPRLHLAGATSTNMCRVQKSVDKAAPLSVVDGDTVAHLSVQLLRAGDLLLWSRSESASPTFAPGHVTAAKLALPLAQLMMCAEAILR